jgi:glycosyltransferase involved in cell wall biosynthesis
MALVVFRAARRREVRSALVAEVIFRRLELRTQRTLGAPLAGVLAEYVVVPAEDAVAAPAHLSDEEAATLPIAALTAWSTLQEGGVKPGKVFVVHNSVDPDRLAEEAAHAARPDLPEASVLVGTLGRLEPVKGLDVLFDAVPLVAGQHPDARFVIAGEGPESENLQMRVATDPVLSKRVEMLGFVPNAPALLDALDVYCLPSRSEGFNTTILEAMALGVPVVATDVGGTREAVEDGVTGRLVPPGDAEALAKALGDLLGDAVLRERLADEARLRVEAQFTVSTMVAKTLAIYERLLAER